MRRLWAKFAKQTWPGETLRFTATLTRKYEEGSTKLADLEVHGTGAEGEKKIITEATVVCV
jgi:acyl dehydratase